MKSELSRHLLAVLSEIEEIVWCINANTYELIYTNGACNHVWGYTPEQMMGDSSLFFNSLFPEDFDVWKKAIDLAKTDGRCYSELRVRHKDGRIKYLQGHAIFKKGTGPLPDTITGIAEDITHINEIKGQLLEKNRELESILQKNGLLEDNNKKVLSLLRSYQKAIDTNIICSITDVHGTITYANEHFCNIAKYTKEELVGKSHRIVNSGYHPKSFFADMWGSIKRGKMWTGEIKNKAKDGTFYWVDTVIMPIKEDDKKIGGYLSLRILIDERKEMEEERSKYTKSIEEMLFMVSHEIRRPITGCQGILEIMSKEPPSSDREYFEYLTHLISAASELDNYSRKLNTYLQSAAPKSKNDRGFQA